jgi:tyrosyl-tRNA synthetase
MTPILEGLDGVQKMSKSLNNAIGIKEPAAEMYGKLMSISDELMWRYWTFLTDLPQSKIDAMRERVKDGAVHPMDVKKELALTITAGFHSVEAAEQAAQGWSTQFQQKGVAEDLPEVEVAASAEGLMADGVVKLPKLLVLTGLAASAGEAQRKIAENAVSVNGDKVTERSITREVLGDAPALRLGKRAVRVRWI